MRISRRSSNRRPWLRKEYTGLPPAEKSGPHLTCVCACLHRATSSPSHLQDRLLVSMQAGDEFVAKQTFISLFRNGMNAFFISL